MTDWREKRPICLQVCSLANFHFCEQIHCETNSKRLPSAIQHILKWDFFFAGLARLHFTAVVQNHSSLTLPFLLCPTVKTIANICHLPSYNIAQLWPVLYVLMIKRLTLTVETRWFLKSLLVSTVRFRTNSSSWLSRPSMALLPLFLYFLFPL